MLLPRHLWKGQLCEVGRVWFGTVGGAAALALAAVLALATLIAGFAAARTLAIVLAFTGVFRRRSLIQAGEAQAGLRHGNLVRALGGRLGRYGGSADQAGESRRQKQCIDLILCHDPLTSFGGLGRMRSAGCSHTGLPISYPAQSESRT